jgi:molybdopterin-guanine dinucleotide biosynthesis protein A
MGTDKARLPVDGLPQAKRIVNLLLSRGLSVTVLGREPVEGADFFADRVEFAGPLAALCQYAPRTAYVFVASCDLPRFDPAIVELLRRKIGAASAAVPVVDEFRQPFCALYSAQAFQKLKEIEDACAMGWLDALEAQLVTETELSEACVDPRAARGANTPEEFAAALSEEIA